MKKTLLCLIALALLASCVTAAESAPITISVAKSVGTNTKYPEGQGYDDNAYTRYIREKANIKIEFAWALDGDAYRQKLAMALTTGDIPDAMVVDRATFISMLEADLLAPLTDYYDLLDPYFKSAYETYQNNSCIEAATFAGELYAIPQGNPGYQHDITWIRNDWLEALKLPDPTNLDELCETALAFKAADFDGNGADDTVGITLASRVFGVYNSSHNANPIAGMFGAYPRMWYEDEHGDAVYGSVTENTRNALAKLSAMYADGVIDEQFAVRDQTELVTSGMCGIMFGPWWMPTWPLNNSYAFDRADWKPLNIPLDDNGKFNAMMPIPATQYLVVSKDCKHPEAVIEILNLEYKLDNFIDLEDKWITASNEMLDSGATSSQPIYLQVSRNTVVPDVFEALEYSVRTGDTSALNAKWLVWHETIMKYYADEHDVTGWAFKVARLEGCDVADSPENTYVTPCFWDVTATMEDKWTSLAKMEDEIFLKVVMGEASLEDFDRFVEDWYRLGGEEITAEVRRTLSERE